MKDRILWADTAKALGMFLVFFGHFIEKAGFAGNEVLLQVYRHIYAFHMPFFFLLAGFFFSKKDIPYGLLFIDKVKNRLVPVLFFVALALPLWMRPDWWGITDVVPEHELQKTWLLLHGKPVANWPCWFLVCLFSVELVASELIPLLNNRLKLLLALPVVYGLAWLATDNLPRKAAFMGTVENWWFLQEGLMALFFYLSGHVLAKHGRALLPGSKGISMLKLAFFSAALVIAQSYVFPDARSSVNMSASAHGHWLWFPLAALAGSLMLVQLSSVLPSHRFLNYIGQNSLPLIGMSGLFLSFFNPLLWPLLDDISNPWLVLAGSVAATLFSLAVCVPVIALLNRFTPFLVGRWK